MSEKYIFAKRSIFLTLKEVQIAQKAHFPLKIINESPHFLPLIYVNYFINFAYNIKDYKVAGII